MESALEQQLPQSKNRVTELESEMDAYREYCEKLEEQMQLGQDEAVQMARDGYVLHEKCAALEKQLEQTRGELLNEAKPKRDELVEPPCPSVEPGRRLFRAGPSTTRAKVGSPFFPGNQSSAREEQLQQQVAELQRHLETAQRNVVRNDFEVKKWKAEAERKTEENFSMLLHVTTLRRERGLVKQEAAKDQSDSGTFENEAKRLRDMETNLTDLEVQIQADVRASWLRGRMYLPYILHELGCCTNSATLSIPANAAGLYATNDAYYRVSWKKNHDETEGCDPEPSTARKEIPIPEEPCSKTHPCRRHFFCKPKPVCWAGITVMAFMLEIAVCLLWNSPLFLQSKDNKLWSPFKDFIPAFYQDGDPARFVLDTTEKYGQQKFRLQFNAGYWEPDEIHVKSTGKSLKICAKQDEESDYLSVYQEFCHRLKLPNHENQGKVVTAFDNGVVTVELPHGFPAPPVEPGTREVATQMLQAMLQEPTKVAKPVTAWERFKRGSVGPFILVEHLVGKLIQQLNSAGSDRTEPLPDLIDELGGIVEREKHY